MAESLREARARQIDARLAELTPDPKVELDFEDAWQLLIATILAAQSTDKLVNTVTPVLFRRWPTPAALGAAAQEEVEEVVHSTGFFRNKAKAVIAASKKLAEDFGGVVPRDIDEVVTLPGVARKTANVVLGSAYGIASGVVVDTHVTRVSQRLGLTAETNAVKIERDLCALLPRDRWIGAGHRLVLHGRYVCKAKKPLCTECVLADLCPSRASDA
ncbi:MAG: endonuclease III [Deltaproteobacteria bacterium]|nr:MAG: endonuclease III [Deltaproteobacteria bacterium]